MDFEVLKDALSVIANESEEHNPFNEPTDADSDTEDANQLFHLLEENENDDDDGYLVILA